jgi:hypothetical protein
MAISGGSAGGFTTLAALAFRCNLEPAAALLLACPTSGLQITLLPMRAMALTSSLLRPFASRKTFQAGCSLYGVADLQLLAGVYWPYNTLSVLITLAALNPVHACRCVFVLQNTPTSLRAGTASTAGRRQSHPATFKYCSLPAILMCCRRGWVASLHLSCSHPCFSTVGILTCWWASCQRIRRPMTPAAPSSMWKGSAALSSSSRWAGGCRGTCMSMYISAVAAGMHGSQLSLGCCMQSAAGVGPMATLPECLLCHCHDKGQLFTISIVCSC